MSKVPYGGEVRGLAVTADGGGGVYAGDPAVLRVDRIGIGRPVLDVEHVGVCIRRRGSGWHRIVETKGGS